MMKIKKNPLPIKATHIHVVQINLLNSKLGICTTEPASWERKKKRLGYGVKYIRNFTGTQNGGKETEIINKDWR